MDGTNLVHYVNQLIEEYNELSEKGITSSTYEKTEELINETIENTETEYEVVSSIHRLFCASAPPHKKLSSYLLFKERVLARIKEHRLCSSTLNDYYCAVANALRYTNEREKRDELLRETAENTLVPSYEGAPPSLYDLIDYELAREQSSDAALRCVVVLTLKHSIDDLRALDYLLRVHGSFTDKDAYVSLLTKSSSSSLIVKTIVLIELGHDPKEVFRLLFSVEHTVDALKRFINELLLSSYFKELEVFNKELEVFNKEQIKKNNKSTNDHSTILIDYIERALHSALNCDELHTLITLAIDTKRFTEAATLLRTALKNSNALSLQRLQLQLAIRSNTEIEETVNTEDEEYNLLLFRYYVLREKSTLSLFKRLKNESTILVLLDYLYAENHFSVLLELIPLSFALCTRKQRIFNLYSALLYDPKCAIEPRKRALSVYALLPLLQSYSLVKDSYKLIWNAYIDSVETDYKEQFEIAALLFECWDLLTHKEKIVFCYLYALNCYRRQREAETVYVYFPSLKRDTMPELYDELCTKLIQGSVARTCVSSAFSLFLDRISVEAPLVKRLLGSSVPVETTVLVAGRLDGRTLKTFLEEECDLFLSKSLSQEEAFKTVVSLMERENTEIYKLPRTCTELELLYNENREEFMRAVKEIEKIENRTVDEESRERLRTLLLKRWLT